MACLSQGIYLLISKRKDARVLNTGNEGTMVRFATPSVTSKLTSLCLLILVLHKRPVIQLWHAIKVKVNQAWSGPEGSRKLRFPDFMTTTQGGGKVVSHKHWPHLPPGNPPGTHFC